MNMVTIIESFKENDSSPVSYSGNEGKSSLGFDEKDINTPLIKNS